MSNFITLKLARQKLAIGQDHEVHATVSLNPPAVEGVERPPLDLAVALDVSGSMRGSKIDNAKRSLLKLVEHLTEQDRLTIVTFESHVATAFAPAKMDAGAKKRAVETINGIQAMSMTDLSGGMVKALAYLTQTAPPKGTLRRCLLFTDGQPTAGVRNPEQLVAIATEMRCGVGISTFGYGTDHDADLLTALALDGNFHYIDTPEKILAAFGVELGGLISTFAQNVQIKLTPKDGVKIAEVLNDVTVHDDNGVVTVEYDDLLAEQPQHLVLKLQIDERKNPHPRGTKLIEVEVSYFNVAAKKNESTTDALKAMFVKAAKADTTDDPAVMEEVVLQQSAKAQQAAMDAADVGDFAQARLFLAESAGLAREHGFDKLADMNDGLAASSYASPDAYVGTKNATRALRRAVSKRQRVVGATLDGVNVSEAFGNDAQAAVMDAFMSDSKADAKPEPVSKPSGSDSSGSLSKSRSNRW